MRKRIFTMLVTAVLALGGIVAFAGSASAYTIDGNVPTCGALKVTARGTKAAGAQMVLTAPVNSGKIIAPSATGTHDWKGTNPSGYWSVTGATASNGKGVCT
jgi:hypothetical protein